MSHPRNEPHKAVPQTSEDRDWATGVWNPKKCNICDRSVNHPIHQHRYRDNPALYKTEHPNK